MDGKRVVILEQNHIIGQHLIELLNAKGHKVYDRVLHINELPTLVDQYRPDTVIINNSHFVKNRNLISNMFLERYNIVLIILFALNPENIKPLVFDKIKYLEKPFVNFELAKAVAAS